MSLRKTKSGQGASKLKPPNYYKELTFLIPYLNDEEERLSNLASISVGSDLDEVQCETPSNLNNLDITTLNEVSDTQNSLSISSVISSRNIHQKPMLAASQTSQEPTAAKVLHEYLSRKERGNRSQK